MWQITWILGLLPDWFWPTLLIIGVLAIIAAWVLKRIPFISSYNLPIRVGGIMSIVVSIWFLGAASNEEKWQAKIKSLEEQVKVAEEKSKETNTVIQEKLVTTTKVIKGKTEYITKYLDKEIIKKEEIVKYIENCPVPKEIIDIHNQAAEMNKAAEVPKK
jgi:hypothetical protein